MADLHLVCWLVLTFAWMTLALLVGAEFFFFTIACIAICPLFVYFPCVLKVVVCNDLFIGLYYTHCQVAVILVELYLFIFILYILI